MLLCTLKSTFAFFTLFFVVDVALLLLAVGYIHRGPDGHPFKNLIQAGGFFALLGAFLAWYNAFAGIADDSNSFFIVPVVHFPWSEKGKESKRARLESAAGQGA